MTADLAFYFHRDGDQIEAFYRGEMSPRRLRILLSRLPPESHLMTAIRNSLPAEELEEHASDNKPEQGRWSHLEQMTATVVDVLHQLVYVTVLAHHSGKGPKPKLPPPMRRPGVGGDDSEAAALTAEAAQVLFDLLNPDSSDEPTPELPPVD